MEKVSTPRPMTHDLIKNVLTGLETQVHKVVVTELREDTFYAVIWLERGGEVISDRFAAVGCAGAGAAGGLSDLCRGSGAEDIEAGANMSDRVTSDELRKYLEGLGDDDMGKYGRYGSLMLLPRTLTVHLLHPCFITRRRRAAARRGAGRRLRDPAPVGPGDRGLGVPRARSQRVADPSGDGRELSRRRSGRRRSAGSARERSRRRGRRSRIDLGARPAAAAALFDRIVAKTYPRRGASDRGRGALRKALAAARRGRLDLSVRPGGAGRTKFGLCPPDRGLSPPRRPTRR